MKYWPVFNMLVIIALLVGATPLAGAIPLQAASPQPEGAGTVFVQLAPKAYETLSGLSPVAVVDYGSFVWLEIPSGQLAVLDAAGIAYELGQTTLSFSSFQFDPKQGEPAIPAGMRAEAEPNEPGLYLVQFVGPLQDSWLNELGAAGLRPLQYYPHNAYLVWGRQAQVSQAALASYVRWSGAFHPAYKIAPGLASMQGLIANVAVTFYNDGNIEASLMELGLLGAYVQHFSAQPDGAFYTAILTLDADQLADIARLPTVWAIEYSAPQPGFDDEIGAQIVVGNYPGGAPVTGYYDWLASKGVNGNGVTWADVDTGLNSSHPDITGRAIAYVSYGSPASTDTNGHGSHTAGAIFGDGRGGTGITDPNGFYWGTGTAPSSTLVVQNGLMGSWPPSGGWQQFSKDSVLNGAVGSSNSWYSDSGGSGYSTNARTHDIMVRDANFDTPAVAEPIIMVFSAGNEGDDCGSGPCYTSITEPKEAKNLIVVGASVNYPRIGASVNGLASFSSRGPAVDGRVLPNVMAPGRQTVSFNGSGSATCGSTVSGAGAAYYNYCSGTSMAAPLVSGASALIVDWWKQEYLQVPSPAMVKALLINGSVDMYGGDNGWGSSNTHIPNNDQGWGLVTLDNVIRAGVASYYSDQAHLFANTGETWHKVFGVADPTQPVKISLVWSDAPGAAGANPALVNNLHLTVVNGSSTYRGNVFSGGWSTTGGSADNLNNIENVYLPAGASGALQITVNAASIAGDGVPYTGDTTDQDFAFVCYNCVESADFTLLVEPATQSVCAPDDALYTVNVGSILGYADSVMLSAAGNPTGTTVNFGPNPVIPPATSTLTISNTGAAADGHYAIDIVGVATTKTHTTTIGLDLFTAVPGDVILQSPADGTTDVSATPTFSWTAAAQGLVYYLEVSSNASFTSVVYTATVAGTLHTAAAVLNTNTRYYWRVTPQNACGVGSPSTAFWFVTLALPGDCSIGQTPVIQYSTDFESGTTGWTHGGTGDTWALSGARTHSGVNAFHANDPATVSDQRLMSPQVVLPSGQSPLTLKFWNHQTMEARTGGCYDGGILEISTNGGSTWTQLQNAVLLTDPYDGPVSTGYSNPLAGLNAWCGDPQDWLLSIADIDAYAGQTAMFRFRLGSDTVASREGWYIDDVAVQSCLSAVPMIDVAPDSLTSVQLPDTLVTKTLVISNPGTADLHWVVTDTIAWLNASPVSGTTSAGNEAIVNMVFDSAGMALGSVYTDDLLIGSNDPANPLITVPALLRADYAPGVIFTKTVGAAPNSCAATNLIALVDGGEATYCYTILNTGDISLALHTLEDSELGSLLNGSSYTLEPGATTFVTETSYLTVTTVNTATWTAYRPGPTYVVSATASATVVVLVHGAQLVAPVSAQAGNPSAMVTYTLRLTNTGDLADTYDITSTGSVWNTQLPLTQILLNPGEGADVDVLVQIPSSAAGGAADAVTITATSQGNSSKQDEVVLTTTANSILQVMFDGAGSGTVTRQPDLSGYSYGTVVTLTAVHDFGSSFAGWSGAVTGMANPALVTMNGHKAVTATFELIPTYTLRMAIDGMGSGAVTPSVGEHAYFSGTIVTLEASPDLGSYFAGWSGDVTGTNTPVTIAIDSEKTITATFELITYTVDVNVVGSGSVALNPDQPYYYGNSITLTATPAAGWAFVEWSGSASGAGSTTSLTIDENETVTATFEMLTYTVDINTVGNGSVALDPNQPHYYYGDSITLTATPAAGWYFDGWNGGLIGKDNPVQLTIDKHTVITATFKLLPTYTLDVNSVGQGVVTATPNLTSYVSGTQVMLQALPAADWSFIGWGGAVTGSLNPITITIQTHTIITATFQLAEKNYTVFLPVILK